MIGQANIHIIPAIAKKSRRGFKTINEFLKFLEFGFQLLRALILKSKSPSDKQPPSRTTQIFTSVVSSACVICKEDDASHASNGP